MWGGHIHATACVEVKERPRAISPFLTPFEHGLPPCQATAAWEPPDSPGSTSLCCRNIEMTELCTTFITGPCVGTEEDGTPAHFASLTCYQTLHCSFNTHNWQVLLRRPDPISIAWKHLCLLSSESHPGGEPLPTSSFLEKHHTSGPYGREQVCPAAGKQACWKAYPVQGTLCGTSRNVPLIFNLLQNNPNSPGPGSISFTGTWDC